MKTIESLELAGRSFGLDIRQAEEQVEIFEYAKAAHGADHKLAYRSKVFVVSFQGPFPIVVPGGLSVHDAGAMKSLAHHDAVGICLGLALPYCDEGAQQDAGAYE